MRILMNFVMLFAILFLFPLQSFEQSSSISNNGYEIKVTSPGDAQYQNSGDPNVLIKGRYVTYDLNKAFKLMNRTQDGAKIGGNILNLSPGIFRIKLVESNFMISEHNTWLTGNGMGTTTLHFESEGRNSKPALSFARNAIAPADQLLRGGGISNLTIKTDNSKITDFGMQLDYVEYMHFENLVFENFFKSALMGCFWESNFENITFRTSGANIKPVSGIPDFGVLDFDSHGTPGLRDAPNNTNFTKITFSSCFGTHIRAVANANSIVNMNFFGLYDETYPGDGGEVDNLPIYYFKGVKNFNVTGGFLTVNTTEVNRNGYGFYIDSDIRNSAISFNNFDFLLNYKGKMYEQNKFRRLKAFGFIGKDQSIILNNVNLNDASGSVGLGLGKKHLIEGGAGALIMMNHVTAHVKKGVWDVQNIFSPEISKSGDLTIVFYDDNGPTGEKIRYNFSLGEIIDGKGK